MKVSLRELFSTCSIVPVTPEVLERYDAFSCGNDDLDDFFSTGYQQFSSRLASKTYAFVRNADKTIVSMFSVSNDSIRLSGLRPEDWENIEYVTEGGEKNLKRWPGVLIGRLGSNIRLMHSGYGSAVMDFIKTWFRSDGNKTGCRFLIVDALNNQATLNYYIKNGFRFFFPSESNEAKSMGLNIKLQNTFPLHTRLMFYDLIRDSI